MASCGVSVNLSSIESGISAHISKISGLAGMAGLPFATAGLLAGMALSNGNYLAALKIVVPSGALDEVWGSLRTEFGNLVDGALEEGVTGLSDDTMTTVFGDDWASRGDLNILQDSGKTDSSFFQNLASTVNTWGDSLSEFADETGLSNLSVFVDINVTDLAKSAIGFGASFDECDFGVSGIGNYFRDPATGMIKLLGNYSPKLGDTSLPGAASRYGFSSAEYLTFAASAKTKVLGMNLDLSSIVSSWIPDEATNLVSVAQNNVSSVTSLYDNHFTPAKGALTSGVRRLANGQTVVENQAAVLDRLKGTMAGRMPATEYSSLSISFST